MASEVGQAYLTLIPSARGFASQMQRELARDVAKAGTALGEELGENIGDSAAKESSSTLGSALSGAKAKALGLVGGLAVGATLAKGLSDAFSADALNAKMQAQLGLTGKQSQKAGKVAGALFGNGYGEGMEQVNEAVASVIQNIDGMRGATKGQLQSIAGQALDVATVFDQDLGGVTRAVSQMMRTGLAKNADQALDIITRGFQSGADKSEDFLDTLNEYGTQFRKMGIDGKTATGLIQQGLQAGARDGDLVADSIKEFSIRAIDGSDATQTAFSAIGLNAQEMEKKIARGGPTAQKALGQTLDALRGIKDPADRARQATALFGTQAEDMGKALFALHPETAAKGLGKVAGATEKANKQLNATPSAQLASFGRKLQQGLINVITKYLLPAVEDLMPLLTNLGGAFDAVLTAITPTVNFLKQNKAIVVGLGIAFAGLTLLVQAHTLAMWLSTNSIKAWVLQTRIVQAVTKAWTAVQWLLNVALNANPISLVVIAVGLLIAAVVIIIKKFHLWDDIIRILGQTWNWLQGIVTGAWAAVTKAVIRGISAVVGLVKAAPGKIMAGLRGLGGLLAGLFKTVWTQAGNAVERGVGTVVSFIAGLPGRILNLGAKFASAGRTIIGKFVDGLKNAAGVVGGIAGNVWSALEGLINSAIDKLNAALSFTINLPGPKDLNINVDIPHLAGGGRATGATLAVIGEGREPETVLPDSMLRGLLERNGGGGPGQVAELTITNWEQGTGYFRLVAAGEVSADHRFRRNLGAMNA